VIDRLVTLSTWLVAGVIVFPALGAALLHLIDRYYWRDASPRHGPWAVATVTLSGTAFLSVGLVITLVIDGPTLYDFGGTLLPEFVFRADALSVTIGVLDVILTLGILAYTVTRGPHSRRFYTAYLLFTSAVFGIVLSGDLVAIFLFVLVLIAVTARLIGFGEKADSTGGVRNYTLTATVGAVVYLCGVVVAFWLTGTTDTEALGAALSGVGYSEPAVVGSFVVMTIGLALLVALFPLHGWLVETHAKSTDPVSALISGVLPAAATYALLRVLFDVYTTEFLQANPTVTDGIIYGAVGSLILGNVLAYGQRDIKGMLAYSTISQFGLVVAGLMVATETAVFGSIIQLFGHGIVKGALCLVAGIVAIRFDARTLDEFGGIATRSPVVAASFVGLGIALIGLPPTVGFVGKWYIAIAAMDQGLWIVVLFVVVSTMLTLGYVVRFIDRLYFAPFEGPDHGAETVTLPMLFVITAAVLISLAIGLGSVFLEDALRGAIEQLVAPE